MTRKLIIPWLALCALAVGSPAQEAGKIVFINLDRAFNEYTKTKIADQQLKESAEEFKQERQAMLDVFNKLQEEFKQLRDDSAKSVLAKEVREKLKQDAEEKLAQMREREGEIRKFEGSRKKQLEEQGRRMRKGIVEDIRTLVDDHARKQGYLAVIDVSGQSLNGESVVLYYDAKLDITEEIIAKLNPPASEPE